MMLPECPADLSFLQPFLLRASELQAANHRIMAYYCTFYAVSLALQKKYSKNPTADRFIAALFDRLEAEKAELGEHAVMKDPRQAATFVREFAYRVFLSADTQDKTNLPLNSSSSSSSPSIPFEKSNARAILQKYLAALNFLQVYRGLFLEGGDKETIGWDEEQLEEEMMQVEEKSKYAKWRAVEIKKMISQEGGIGSGKSSGLSNTPTMINASQQQQQQQNTLYPSNQLNNHMHMPLHQQQQQQPLEPTKQQQLQQQEVPVHSPTLPMCSPKILTDCEKHARYAISALQFDDIVTAKQNLQAALDILNSIDHRA